MPSNDGPILAGALPERRIDFADGLVPVPNDRAGAAHGCRFEAPQPAGETPFGELAALVAAGSARHQIACLRSRFNAEAQRL